MSHVIVGAGTVGTAIALRLAEEGQQVRLVSRRGRGPNRPGIENVAGDATDGSALAGLCTGASVLYNCANPSSYARWASQWPPLAAGILTAAEASGAVLVTLSNLYGYGPVDVPMTEGLPLAATGKKGRIRAAMWSDALVAHRSGRAPVAEARGSDYFGPGFTETAHMGSRVVPRIMAGKTVRVLGDPDAPHTWTYLDDVVATLVVLGRDERAWGRAWHVPSGPPLSQRQMVTALAGAAGVPAPAVAALPAWALRALGVVSPVVREMDEVLYQFDRPFIMDSSAVTTTFGLTATPVDRAARTTVDWWKNEAMAAAGASQGDEGERAAG
jgi:nucleoside-diphosphate-sugar epimerase